MEASFQPADAIPISSGRADYRATDARILRVAARVLSDDPHASVAAIAERAGVSRATMYRHYSSIGALLHALRTHVLAAELPARTRLLAALSAPEPSAGDIAGAFSAYVREAFAAFDADPDGVPGVVVWDPALRRELADSLGPAGRAAIARLQRLGVASRDFDVDTLLRMLGAILLDGARQVTVGEARARDAAALVQHTVLIGLRARARRDGTVTSA